MQNKVKTGFLQKIQDRCHTLPVKNALFIVTFVVCFCIFLEYGLGLCVLSVVLGSRS
jgi:hypothetical protein